MANCTITCFNTPLVKNSATKNVKIKQNAYLFIFGQSNISKYYFNFVCSNYGFFIVMFLCM